MVYAISRIAISNLTQIPKEPLVHQENTLKLGAVIFAMLFFNALGGVVAKYIAFSDGWLLFLLSLLLGATFFARAVAWMWAGKHYQLSYIYPFMSINFIVATLIGSWLFHERITFGKVVGSLLIVLGVYVLTNSKSRAVS